MKKVYGVCEIVYDMKGNVYDVEELYEFGTFEEALDCFNSIHIIEENTSIQIFDKEVDCYYYYDEYEKANIISEK